MGKAERIACIATPYILTIGALVCLILVNFGSTDSRSSTLDDLYLFRVSKVQDTLSRQSNNNYAGRSVQLDN
jgi:hypothetical protein